MIAIPCVLAAIKPTAPPAGRLLKNWPDAPEFH